MLGIRRTASPSGTLATGCLANKWSRKHPLGVDIRARQVDVQADVRTTPRCGVRAGRDPTCYRERRPRRRTTGPARHLSRDRPPSAQGSARRHTALGASDLAELHDFGAIGRQRRRRELAPTSRTFCHYLAAGAWAALLLGGVHRSVACARMCMEVLACELHVSVEQAPHVALQMHPPLSTRSSCVGRWRALASSTAPACCCSFPSLWCPAANETSVAALDRCLVEAPPQIVGGRQPLWCRTRRLWGLSAQLRLHCTHEAADSGAPSAAMCADAAPKRPTCVHVSAFKTIEVPIVAETGGRDVAAHAEEVVQDGGCSVQPAEEASRGEGAVGAGLRGGRGRGRGKRARRWALLRRPMGWPSSGCDLSRPGARSIVGSLRRGRSFRRRRVRSHSAAYGKGAFTRRCARVRKQAENVTDDVPKTRVMSTGSGGSWRPLCGTRIMWRRIGARCSMSSEHTGKTCWARPADGMQWRCKKPGRRSAAPLSRSLSLSPSLFHIFRFFAASQRVVGCHFRFRTPVKGLL